MFTDALKIKEQGSVGVKKYLTFEIEEKVGLLRKICACQDFKEVPHDNVPERKRGIKLNYTGTV